jgi:hypothetical protein
MKPARHWIRFILLLTLYYALLIAPWPGLEDAYARAFRAVAQRVLFWYGADGVIRFEAGAEQDETHDTGLVAQNKRTGAFVGMGIDTRYEGYVPTVFLLSLTLASPVAWRRRGWALVWGMLAVHVFIALKLLVMVTYLFSLDHPASLFALSDFWDKVLAGLLQMIAPSPLTWLIVPLFIWILVTFRREDFSASAGDEADARRSPGRKPAQDAER